MGADMPSQDALLSPGEWEVFATISRQSPMSISEVMDVLNQEASQNPRHRTTIMTYVQRLTKKGYLNRGSREGDPLSHIYWPAVSRQRAFQPLVERFFDQFALDLPEDLEAIRRLAEERLARLDTRSRKS
jgi:predicted transcriptional regulator